MRSAAMSTILNKLPRLLSIQSHTVHGHVGNKAVTLPLQCLGYNVDAVNTVSLSNHPGYPAGAQGEALSSAAFQNVMNGLNSNSLNAYDVVLTGYFRSCELIEQTGTNIDLIRTKNHDALYVCDPVLGDNGKYYVPEALRDSYLKNLIPRASMVVPNQFEAEVLSGIAIDCLASARLACDFFHSMGVPICVLKGLSFGEDSYSVVLSVRGEQSFVVQKPAVRIAERAFSGCGDLFTALLAGLLFKHAPCSSDRSIARLSEVVEQAVEVMDQVLHATQTLESKELCIVESLDLFRRMKELLPHSDFNCRTSAHLVHGSDCLGVIFDMDGTLTLPGAINFDAMYERTGLSRHLDDIVCQIEALPAEAKAAAYAIVEEEEMLGVDNMVLQDDLHDVLAKLHASRLRVAISTRNCGPALDRFLEAASIFQNRISPLLHRHSLDGINKPDPRVAEHVLQAWGLPAHRVWFVGDSLDDMLCGKQAGCRTCLILNERNRHLADQHPDAIDLAVDSLSDFSRHIGLSGPVV